MRHTSFLFVLFATVGCTDGADTDTDTDSDTDTDTINTNSVLMTRSPVDGISGVVVSDATASLDGEQLTLDAESNFEFILERGEPAELVVSAEDYLDTVEIYHPDDELGIRGSVLMLSEAIVGALGSQLGLERDPEKAIVYVNLSDTTTDPYSTIPGATITLSAASDASLVSDASSAFQVSGGNTTLEGSASNVFFVNVPTGELDISVDLPDGLSGCEYSPGGVALEAWSPTIPADAFVGITLLCE